MDHSGQHLQPCQFRPGAVGVMPKFKVTVRDERVVFLTKVFEAATEEDAQQLAEADDTWSTDDGWKVEHFDSNVECGIDFIEPLT